MTGVTPASSAHRLQCGLPGYLILFAPHTFEPQRQLEPSRPPSPLVFLLISTHFTATLGIPPTPPALKSYSFSPITELSSALLNETYITTCARFTPNNSGQRSPPTYYRGCWHVVSRGFLLRYRHCTPLFTKYTFFPEDRDLQPEGLLLSRGVAPSGFRPLWKIPHCCLP